LVLVVAIPEGGELGSAAGEARACARRRGGEGPFACYGPHVAAFVAAATWAGANLPEGSAVLTRKPRIFYVLSGVPSRTFPFDADPEVLLGLADDLGAAYVLLDEWDGLAAAYVGGAVTRHPGAFCYVRGFGRPGAGGAQLLGILPPAGRAGAAPTSAADVRIEACPDGYSVGQEEPDHPSSSSTRIPLLEGLDP
jgi:hypothetical protein